MLTRHEYHIHFLSLLFTFTYFSLSISLPTPEKYGKISLNKMETIGLYTNTDKWKSAKEKATTKVKKLIYQ